MTTINELDFRIDVDVPGGQFCIAVCGAIVRGTITDRQAALRLIEPLATRQESGGLTVRTDGRSFGHDREVQRIAKLIASGQASGFAVTDESCNRMV